MGDREHFESSRYGEGPSRLFQSPDDCDFRRTIHQKIREAESQKDFGACLTLCCEALKMAPNSSEFLIMKATFLVKNNRSVEANEILGEILRKDPQNAKALAILGLVFYLQGNLKKSVEVFGSALQNDGGLKQTKILRDKASKLIDIFRKIPSIDSPSENFTPHVMFLIKEGLTLDPANKEVTKTLRFHQGYHNFMNERYHDAINDFTEALKLDEANVTLFMLRAKCYIAVRSFDDAMIDLLEANNLKDKSRKVSSEIESLRKEIGKVYVSETNYAFLEVLRTATQNEIKISFDSLSLLHKVNLAKAKTAAEKRKLDFKYKRVENAFAILSSAAHKKTYDKLLEKQEASIECPTITTICGNVANCYQGCCVGCGNCFSGFGKCCAGFGSCLSGTICSSDLMTFFCVTLRCSNVLCTFVILIVLYLLYISIF